MYYHRKSIRLNGYDYSKNGYYFVTICAWRRCNVFGSIVRARRDSPKIELNNNRKIIESIWKTLPKHHNVLLDEFCIMPNHIHGILIINNKIGRTQGSAPTFKNTNNFPPVGVDPRVDPNHDSSDPRVDPNFNPKPTCINQNFAIENIYNNDNCVGVDPRVDPNSNPISTHVDPNHDSSDPRVDHNQLGIIIKKFKTLTTKIFMDNIQQNNWPKFNHCLWQRNYYERIIRNEKEYQTIKEYIRNNPKNT